MNNSTSESQVREIVMHGENDRVEFKTHIPDLSTLVKHVSAMANTHGGTIYVGIQEPQWFVGTQPEQVIKLVERAKPLLLPSVDLQVQTIEVDHKPIVAISVPESKEVVFGNGMALRRVGDRIIPLSTDELSRKITSPADPVEIRKLADAISKQTAIIEKLRDELKVANSFKSKLKDYLIGGVIGAIFGAIATSLL